MSPLDYAVYGVLAAARIETGPKGARRMYRIQERLNCWDDEAMIGSLVSLIDAGWIQQQPRDEFGYVYYEVMERAGQQ